MSFIEIILLALSLSIDSFVVSMSGSVSLGKVTFGKLFVVSLVFGLMQVSLMFLGWALGHSVVSFVTKIANFIGFGLLLYVGLSMAISALKKKTENETVDLSGVGHLLMAAAATSIDALAVGASLAMAAWSMNDIFWVHLAVFAVTMFASSAGMLSGSAIGRRFGRPAQFIGGLVLIGLGVCILLG